MHKPMLGLMRVRLWVGIAMLTMGLGMGACQQTAIAPNSTNSSDSRATQTNEDDPPEKPGKPGGGN